MRLLRTDAGVAIRRDDGDTLPIRQIIAVGRNYAEHAKERGADAPERPMLFCKNIASLALDGEDIVQLPMHKRARRGIGYLPQEASIFRGLTVEQNLRAVVELVHRNKEKQQSLIDDLLTEFNITHIRKAPALALSGGERRRVEIARALATGPAFMLLDEPFAGIDPLAIADIRELVIHLRDRGLGVLITDHNVRETLDIIDRAYIIHEGQVLIEGAPGDIVGDKDVRRVYLGDAFQM